MKLQFITSLSTPYGNTEIWIDTENDNQPKFILDRSTAAKQIKLKEKTESVWDPETRKSKRIKTDIDCHSFLILDDWEFSDLLSGECDDDSDLQFDTIPNVTELCRWINRNS